MTAMSSIEARFCRSAPWRGVAGRVVLPWAIKDTTLGPRILEIGGGSGAMAHELLMRHPDVHVTVADIDPAMVNAAQARLEPFGQRAAAVVGDATDLDVADNSFDTVCTWLMLHHTLDWPQVVAEVVRVVRPGGTILGYDLTNSGVARLTHRLDRSEHRLIRPRDLRSELDRLGLQTSRVETSLGGLVMRFRAVKTTASLPSSDPGPHRGVA